MLDTNMCSLSGKILGVKDDRFSILNVYAPNKEQTVYCKLTAEHLKNADIKLGEYVSVDGSIVYNPSTNVSFIEVHNFEYLHNS